MHFAKLLLALLGLVALAACSRATPAGEINGQARQPGSPAAVAAAAIAAQTGGDVDDVHILSVEAMEFGDSSLGCPQPGMAYLQVVTAGYKVTAEYAGKNFDVRVAGGRSLICDPRAERDTATVPR